MLEENKGLRGGKKKKKKSSFSFFFETTSLCLSPKVSNCALCPTTAQHRGFQEAQLQRYAFC